MPPRQSLKRQTYMATRAPDNAYRDEETMEPGSYQLSMSVLMTPDKANFSGNVHGGALLKMLDEVEIGRASCRERV